MFLRRRMHNELKQQENRFGKESIIKNSRFALCTFKQPLVLELFFTKHLLFFWKCNRQQLEKWESQGKISFNNDNKNNLKFFSVEIPVNDKTRKTTRIVLRELIHPTDNYFGNKDDLQKWSSYQSKYENCEFNYCYYKHKRLITKRSIAQMARAKAQEIFHHSSNYSKIKRDVRFIHVKSTTRFNPNRKTIIQSYPWSSIYCAVPWVVPGKEANKEKNQNHFQKNLQKKDKRKNIIVKQNRAIFQPRNNRQKYRHNKNNNKRKG
jgi:hypothetical protein